MIICSNCHHEEMDGTLFCSQCGCDLTSATLKETHKITHPYFDNPDSSSSISEPDISGESFSPISLNLVESGKIIPLSDGSDFTLGRITEGQPIMPDIDLSPYNAYSEGVSRLHALLKLENNQIIIKDLGSSNGTFINNIRLAPHEEKQVNHGDVINLGRLKIQILVNPHS